MDQFDPDEWLFEQLSAMTPEEWADEALASAQVKKTKRPHLRAHLGRVIKLAQEVAASRALRERDEKD